MKKTYHAYTELLRILWSITPFLVVATVAVAVVQGALGFVLVWVNGAVLNQVLRIVREGSAIVQIAPLMLVFVVASLLPLVLSQVYLKIYAEPKTLLVLRTAMRGRMLQKLSAMKYEHLENKDSMEIISKAFARIEEASIHLFPMFLFENLSSIVFCAGTLVLFAYVKWWLVLTILIPFGLETFFAMRSNYNIYNEMETYWDQELEYDKIGSILRSREFLAENRLYQNTDFLINEFSERMARRNSSFEGFFLKNFKRQFTHANLTKLLQFGNAVLLLWIYSRGEVSVGLLISLTLTLFTTLLSWSGLAGTTLIAQWGGFHANTFAYYDKFLKLSERKQIASTSADVLQLVA